MKFTVSRSVILGGVQKVLGITDKTTTSPLFNNLHLIADSRGIVVEATDLEISIVVNMAARVEEEGSVLLTARRVYEMLREMQGGEEVIFTEGEGKLISMHCGKAWYKIQGIGDDEYPSISVETRQDVMTVSADKVAGMVKKSLISASNEPMRRNINGVFFEVDDEGLARMIGTDGNRLSLFCVSDAVVTGKMGKGLIVSKRGAVELKRNIEGIEGEVVIGLNGNFVVVKAGNMIMQLNTIEAEYPDYRRVIALSHSVPLVGNKEEILRSLKIMRVVADKSYTGVTMSITKNRIEFSLDANVGEASDEIVVDYGGSDLSISYNVHFLIEAIEAVEGNEVLLDLGAEGKPLFIKDVGGDDYIAVVMPVRLV